MAASFITSQYFNYLDFDFFEVLSFWVAAFNPIKNSKTHNLKTYPSSL